ncbi:MAG: hypothetical protein AB7P99_16970 [Vicinamibacterales bacterium]
MPLPAHRSVVIISGLLTVLVLGGGTLAVGFHNGWLRTTPSTPVTTQDEAGVYRQKLEEAYRDLDAAYAQIGALQSAQSQIASARTDGEEFGEDDDDDERRGRRSDGRRSHDD